MNYRDTLTKAARLEELAKSLKSIASEVEESVAACTHSGWEGYAKNEFSKKNTQYAEKVKANAYKLEICAGLLRLAAREYYRTEMTLLSIIGG